MFRKYLLIIAALVLACNLSLGQRIQTVELGSNKYFISNASPYAPQLNWFLSYQYCRTIGMELLTLNSIEKTNQLMGFLRENNYNTAEYWTSGNQLGSPMWIWMSTGQPYNSTFNSWAAGGPPLTKSSQSCMDVKAGVWSPQNCMDNKAFICELTRCFYFNYVTTNKVPTSSSSNSQGKISVQTVNQRPLSPVRSSTVTGDVIKNRRTSTQSVKRPVIPKANQRMRKPATTTTPRPAVLKKMNTRTTTSLPRTTMNKFTTTGRPVKVMPQAPVKVMPQAPVKVMPQHPVKMMPQNPVKVMPQNPVKVMTSTVKSMPGSIKVMPTELPNAVSASPNQNEIIPKEIPLIARFIPPIHEFQPGATTDKKTTPNVLERKEIFSWALKKEEKTSP